ncbi:hypothetical protein AgCh_037640 [Apium graveolens]
MAFTIKNVNKIRQIVRLKLVMQRWKSMSVTAKRVPSGSLGVYVGVERCRFVIPTRYLKLPLFVSLLEKAEEEYGFQSDGGLVLPCEVDFFEAALELLERDEHKFGGIQYDELFELFSSSSSSFECDVSKGAFTPLLHRKARV